MARGYKQTFTLNDLFSDKDLSSKLPYIRYKEKEENGKLKQRTSIPEIGNFVYKTAKASAKPYYKPMVATKNENKITIQGNLLGDIKECENAVYNALVSARQLMVFMANNVNMIRDALKEGAKKGFETNGQTPKLWLRVGSKQEIANMNNRQVFQLVNNVMQNIYYSDDFAKTRKKYKVEQQPNYALEKLKWEQMVGKV